MTLVISSRWFILIFAMMGSDSQFYIQTWQWSFYVGCMAINCCDKICFYLYPCWDFAWFNYPKYDFLINDLVKLGKCWVIKPFHTHLLTKNIIKISLLSLLEQDTSNSTYPRYNFDTASSIPTIRRSHYVHWMCYLSLFIQSSTDYFIIFSFVKESRVWDEDCI